MRHTLDRWLWHSLRINFLELLIVLLRIHLEVLVIIIISWILALMSSTIESLVLSFSLIDPLVSLLISLDYLKKRLQHLCQMRLWSQLIPIKPSFFLCLQFFPTIFIFGFFLFCLSHFFYLIKIYKEWFSISIIVLQILFCIESLTWLFKTNKGIGINI